MSKDAFISIARSAFALPRSTIAVAALTAAVFVAVGLVSCSGLGELKPLPPFDASLPGEPDIRVRIVRGAEAMELAGPRLLAVRSVRRGRTWRLRTPVRVVLGSHGFELTGLDGVAARPGRGESVIVEPPADAGLIAVDGTAYPGALRLDGYTTGGERTFDAIASMPMEQYLPGVLAKELYHSWPLEAFQAQAVAARSYALHERARARSVRRAFDVEATTIDQAFAGATQLPVAQRAVESTRGQALTWRGGVLRAYYSSTTGTRAASARDTWPTGKGYEFNLAAPLQASEREYADEASPAFRWQTRRGVARLSLRLRRWGQENGHAVKHIDQVVRASVHAANGVGRPTKYRVSDNRGRSFDLSGEELRVACNWPVPGVSRVNRADRVRSGDMTLKVVGARVHINGRGFGHGVGMSQWSAAALAKQGEDYRSIVLRFYPGARIERVY